MPDDDRTRRRLGDATKGRIADLASGWSVDEAAPEAAPEPAGPANAPRQKSKTLPPPPPGSIARKALEDAIVDSKTPTPVPAASSKSNIGPVAAIAPSKSTFGAKSGPTETGTVERSGVIGSNTELIAKSGLLGPRPGATANKSGPTAIPQQTAATESGPNVPLAARSGPRTQPPPLPAAKVGSSSGATARLPLRADATDVSAPPAAVPPPIPPQRAQRAPAIIDEPLETIPEDHANRHGGAPANAGAPGSSPRLAVPVGEFDNAGTLLEQDKLRIAYEQSTIKRDAASAVLGIAEPSETLVKSPPVGILLEETAQHLLRGDPTSIEAPETTRFERGDPTFGDRGDPTTVAVPSPGHTSAGKLRNSAALRRKRGFGGDLRYVATVLFGVRRARAELAVLEARQEVRQQSRRRYLVTLGRSAVTLDDFDHPALGPARELLAGVEDERSQHAGAVAAADSELTRVRRDRDAKAKQYLAELSAIDGELADITKKLEPLEKEALGITKRAAELRDSVQRIEKTIAATEASLVAVNKPTVDRAGIQAELATLRADRMAVQRDEPKIASELDALNPRVAALEARRNEARKRRTELEQAEREDQRRSEELLAAIGAKRKVVDRAAGDAEAVRDKVLFELGERLFVDQPEDVVAQLAPIDEIDFELGTGERRMMELREIISSVDKAKLARGIALGVLLLAIVGGVVAAFLYAAI